MEYLENFQSFQRTRFKSFKRKSIKREREKFDLSCTSIFLCLRKFLDKLEVSLRFESF